MSEVRPTMPGHLTGATTSTQGNRWSSAIPKQVSRHSGHGWRRGGADRA